jgi:hypothetical protein
MSLGSNALLVELQEAVFLNPVLACEREMPRSRSSINVPSRDLDFLPPPSGSRAAHRSSDTRSVRRSESRGLGQRTPLPVGQLVFKGDRLAVDCGEQRHAGRRVDGFSDDHYPRLRKSDFKIRASALGCRSDRDIQGSVAIRSHLLPGPPGPAPTLRIDHQLLPAWRNGIREDSARPKIFPVHPRIELTIAT